jgi:hypothetical protein
MERTALAGKIGQDSWGSTAKTEPLWQDKQDGKNKIARTGQLGQDSQDSTSVAGQLRLTICVRTVMTGNQERTAGKGQSGQVDLGG